MLVLASLYDTGCVRSFCYSTNLTCLLATAAIAPPKLHQSAGFAADAASQIFIGLSQFFGN
jgi:hypothetical protein